MAIEQRTNLTAEEFLHYRGKPDKRYELVDGEVIEMSPPGGEHGEIAFKGGFVIATYVIPRNLGRLYAAKTGFRIRESPDRVRAPDIAFVSRGRLPEGPTTQQYVPLAPDFVVEVVSPNDSAADVQDRVDDWLRAGTVVVWVVYPSSRSVLVWRGLDRVERRAKDDDLDAEPVLPGFTCKVFDLFVED